MDILITLSCSGKASFGNKRFKISDVVPGTRDLFQCIWTGPRRSDAIWWCVACLNLHVACGFLWRECASYCVSHLRHAQPVVIPQYNERYGGRHTGRHRLDDVLLKHAIWFAYFDRSWRSDVQPIADNDWVDLTFAAAWSVVLIFEGLGVLYNPRYTCYSQFKSCVLWSSSSLIASVWNI